MKECFSKRLMRDLNCISKSNQPMKCHKLTFIKFDLVNLLIKKYKSDFCFPCVLIIGETIKESELRIKE